MIAWLRSAGAAASVRAVMQGPAEWLWRQAFPAHEPTTTLEPALDGAEALMTGSGWASDLEHRARALARRRNIISVTVLDHWVNYAERFERGGTRVLPDEIWVVDEEAQALATATFPALPVRRIANHYLAEQMREILAADGAARELLYLLEPMRNEWGRGIPGEFQALDFFIDTLPAMGVPAGTPIRLRPHPSESRAKYAQWLQQHPALPIGVDDEGTLAQAIARAGWVVGCETLALTVALAAGRRVYCSLPPWAPPCRLPHAGIVHLRSFSERR